MANFSKSNVPQFSVDVYQNEFLPEGGREVNAIVTVTSTGGGTSGAALTGASTSPAPSPGQAPGAAVVIMVDCSGSMDYPPTKMRNAREATASAIDALRDGTAFSVVAGTHVAKDIYPGNGRLAVAGPQTRAQAREALRGLSAGGGTAIGTWLRLADRLLNTPAAPGDAVPQIKHGILLTDGRNEHEAPEDLRASLDAAAGRFTCDARGVGTDWEVKEVTGIASALLGTADIVADPSHLSADFTRMMENAMGKEVADVALRLWTPVGVEIRYVKQVAPTVQALTGRRTEVGPRAGDYPTGSWGDESRDYHLCVQVPEAGIGQEMLAARVSLVLPGPAGARRRPSRRVWSARSGRTTWSLRPRSTHRSRTTQARLNWHKPSNRALMPANPAIWTERPRSSAARSSLRPPRGTRTLRNCSRRWWTSSTKRPVLCD